MLMPMSIFKKDIFLATLSTSMSATMSNSMSANFFCRPPCLPLYRPSCPTPCNQFTFCRLPCQPLCPPPCQPPYPPQCQPPCQPPMVAHHVSHHVSHHVTDHNVVLTLCEVSETKVSQIYGVTEVGARDACAASKNDWISGI